MKPRGAWPVVCALVTAVACQPWYRDLENRGREARADRPRASHEVDEARAEAAGGHAARAAARLRSIVQRDPDSADETWLLLGEVSTTAGRAAEGRAYVRWRLGQLAPEGERAAKLRTFLVRSLVAEGLTSDALDLVRSPTLPSGLELEGVGLGRALGGLASARDRASSEPSIALGRLQAWLVTYGAPDHPLLEDARETIAQAAWAASGAASAPIELAILRRLVPYAREEQAQGRTASALELYARAWRLLPARAFAPVRGEMARAAALADPARVAPEAFALARHGDVALRAGKLAEAIDDYRHAVALAPWWQGARQNLAALRAVDR